MDAVTISIIVFEHWMQTGDAATVKVIAAEVAKNRNMKQRSAEALVRKVLAACNYNVPNSTYTTASVPQYSRSYPAIQVGILPEVSAWLPSREAVRAEIARTRAELERFRNPGDAKKEA